jgi:hypothetical protein
VAFWPPEVEWHERDVVVPAFRRWLETQGRETETETGFVDVVAHRGTETIYAEVKGRTKSRPGAGLDTLYGQLLRRMPVEEVGDPNTRFAVVIPTGAQAAALRVPRRVRDLLRIDIYAVSDDGHAPPGGSLPQLRPQPISTYFPEQPPCKGTIRPHPAQAEDSGSLSSQVVAKRPATGSFRTLRPMLGGAPDA